MFFTTMKLIFLALVVAYVSNTGLAEHSNSLPRDIEDFVDLLDIDQITRLTNMYYSNDKDFQSMLEYLQSIEFSTVWNGFFSLATIRDVGLYLSHEGVPFYDYVALVATFIGQSPSSRMVQHLNKTKYRGLKAYVEELFSMLPLQEWQHLYDIKQTNSAPFKVLISKLHRISYMQLKQFYEDCKELRSFVQVLRSHGLDVDSVTRYLRNSFHWDNTVKTSEIIGVARNM